MFFTFRPIHTVSHLHFSIHFLFTERREKKTFIWLTRAGVFFLSFIAFAFWNKHMPGQWNLKRIRFFCSLLLNIRQQNKVIEPNQSPVSVMHLYLDKLCLEISVDISIYQTSKCIRSSESKPMTNWSIRFTSSLSL